MSDSRRQSKQQELENMQQKMQRYQMEKFRPEGEIYRIQAQLLSPVLAKLDEIIRNSANGNEYIHFTLGENVECVIKNEDTWSFEKPINSKDPNWLLSST